jgi:hypothetical protein
LARRNLDQTRKNGELRKRSYAVIPYQGPNGTRRRPIYVECRSDSVVIQPEGIVLRAEDFAGPTGPGNPLEAALRAVREHILRAETGQDGKQPAEPYPLLLVRPSGIEAYTHARAAMTSWGSDFGYELIEDDWQIEFDEADPELAREAAEAVAAARRKLALLAQAAPRYYGGHQAPTYAVKPYRGGVMRTGGQGGEADDAGQPSGGTGWSTSPSSSDGPSEQGGGSGGSQATEAGSQGGISAGHNPLRGARQNEADLAGRPGIGRDGQFSANGTAAAGNDQGSRSESGGYVPRPGEWIPQSTSRESPRSNGRPSAGPDCPLAEIRGKNWALPDAANGSVGITRPIRVDCHPDRLELAPDAGRARSQVVALGDRTEDTVDTFISAVWDHMEAWGIAGRGMYWQPILSVQVSPGGERRFADLKTLLEGSGLEVKRTGGTGVGD